jgi:hypothetical protein
MVENNIKISRWGYSLSRERLVRGAKIRAFGCLCKIRTRLPQVGGIDLQAVEQRYSMILYPIWYLGVFFMLRICSALYLSFSLPQSPDLGRMYGKALSGGLGFN